MNPFNIPPYESELILSHILQKSREYVLTHPEIALNKAQKAKFLNLIKRRQKYEPLAYILGHKEFYGLDFKVDKNVLIPRPETELLVEEIIKLDPKGENIIDIGTGSGNIVISLAKSIGEKNNFFAVDISEKALRIAKYNAKKHKVDKKIDFIKSDLLKNKKLLDKIKNKKIIMVANLPYLSKKIYSSTMPDVKNYEPQSALLSGDDGLDHYKKLFSQIGKLLVANCRLLAEIFLEISPEQKTKMEKMIRKYFPKCKMNFIKDISGRWRVVKIKI
jgi:release factor glutamine methyltransferase